MTRLRLVLGDQLDSNHGWFERVEPDVVYLLMEVRQETDYVLHHAQKVIAFFAAMRAFATFLADAGHRVEYLRIADPRNRQGFAANLEWLVVEHRAVSLEWQSPDEWRLDRQMRVLAGSLPIPAREVASQHFLAERNEAVTLFGGKPRWLMETFYRHMRKRHGLLLDAAGRPLGERWNFDRENRSPWRGAPPEPSDPRPRRDRRDLWAEIQSAGVKTFGNPQAEDFRWPATRAEALALLEAFITQALPHFGPFQDAMHTQAPRLFHSLLSFPLNIKLLHPKEIAAAAEQAFLEGRATLASVEGFVRQIVGWREYVRGVYWSRMPGYEEVNYFDHQRPLPSWFWTGKTKMRCLAHALGQSLETAYAHHIQRLMVIGNFALLAGLAPRAVHEWYLGVYIDAVEWVEMPNTLGMSQFADGGLLATKPYVSSAAYLKHMGDYCVGCAYDAKTRLGKRACPFNALYWNFFIRHQTRLGGNPRLGTVFLNLARMTAEEKRAVTEQATGWLERIEDL